MSGFSLYTKKHKRIRTLTTHNTKFIKYEISKTISLLYHKSKRLISKFTTTLIY